MAHVIRLVPGIAAVVSTKIFSGSWPETNVSEQRTFATNPVTTVGTSRARAAASASALSAVVVARTRISFRRVIGVSPARGVLKQKPQRADERSPELETGLAESQT